MCYVKHLLCPIFLQQNKFPFSCETCAKPLYCIFFNSPSISASERLLSFSSKSRKISVFKYPVEQIQIGNQQYWVCGVLHPKCSPYASGLGEVLSLGRVQDGQRSWPGLQMQWQQRSASTTNRTEEFGVTIGDDDIRSNPEGPIKISQAEKEDRAFSEEKQQLTLSCHLPHWHPMSEPHLQSSSLLMHRKSDDLSTCSPCHPHRRFWWSLGPWI